MRRLIVVMTLCATSCNTFRTSTTPSLPQPLDERIEELVRTTDDRPDPLHFFSTPSVHKLIELGRPVIPRMLDLMLSEEEDTRIRAMHVLLEVTMPMFGYIPGKGWPEHEDHDRWEAFWKAMGNLDADQPRKQRERSVRLWYEWLTTNEP